MTSGADGTARPPMARYRGFLGLAALLTVGLLLLGVWPTRALAGDGSLMAMLAGCAASFLATAMGGIPILLAADRRPGDLSPVFVAMGLRLLVVLAVAVALALSGAFARAPLLLWTAISYLVLLVADTRYALASFRG